MSSVEILSGALSAALVVVFGASYAACHGQRGEGNEALGAPGLAALDDWYLIRQLRLYVEGLRGFQPGDTFGLQMRAIAGTAADPQAQRDLAAYIRSLAD